MIRPEHSLSYRENTLYIEEVPLEKLIARFGSPLYVYSAKAIRDSYEKLTSAFKGMNLQVCYAVKANSNIHLLEELRDLGAGCDLVSYGEWYRAEKAKIPRNLRVLSGVAKTEEELKLLLKSPGAGVGSVHVESVMELELLSKLATKAKRKVKIALRYNPDVDAQTLDKISTGRKKDKFGLTTDEIIAMAKKFKKDPWINLAGLSIHIGSQITSLAPYEKSFKLLLTLCKEVEKITGRDLEYVDLGGGIGIQYLDEKPISLDKYVALVKKYFHRYSKILLEPGRSMVANAGYLASSVVYTKIRADHRTLILDAGMNDLMRPALYDAYHQILPVKNFGQKGAREQKWDVVGGICETTDYFARARPLAVKGEAGEQVVFLSAGAYGFSMSNTYNTRPRVAEVLVDGTKVKLIRRRETLDDLIRHEE